MNVGNQASRLRHLRDEQRFLDELGRSIRDADALGAEVERVAGEHDTGRIVFNTFLVAVLLAVAFALLVGCAS